MEHQPVSQPGQSKPGKKRKWLKWTLLSLLGVLLLCVIAAVVLGGSLLSRLAKPGTTVFGEEEPEEVSTPAPSTVPSPTPRITATLAPGAAASPSPTPLPTPEPDLPLQDLYPQTRLTQAQLDLMDSLNANTNQYVNVLLVGVDRRGRSGNSQADTMLIATLDKKNGRLKLTSLLRDLLVDIPGYGAYRINSAATKGGMDLLLETLNHNFSLNITKYVLVDFSMFEKIVDKMGGVTVRMTAAEISAANDCIAGLNKQRGVDYLWDGFIFAEAGNVKCTGKQALGYARIRKIDSDFSRTNRQFKVLTAIFAKFKSKNLAQQYDILNELLPLVETNLSAGEIIDCAISALSMDTQGLLHYTIPIDGLYRSGRVNGSSVLLPDLPAHAWLLHQFLYYNDDLPDEAKVLSAGASLPPRTPSPTLEPWLDPSLWPEGYTPQPGETPSSLLPTDDSGLSTPVPEPESTPEAVEIPEVEVPEGEASSFQEEEA